MFWQRQLRNISTAITFCYCKTASRCLSVKSATLPGTICTSVKSQIKSSQSSVYVTFFRGAMGSIGAVGEKRSSISMNTLT